MNTHKTEPSVIDEDKPKKTGLLAFAAMQSVGSTELDDAPQPVVSKSKKGKRTDKVEAEEFHLKVLSCLSSSLGTGNEADKKSKYTAAKVIKKIESLEDLADATHPLVPIELVDVDRILNKERPLLHMQGTLSADSKPLVYLYGSTADINGGCGWYSIQSDGTFQRATETKGLYETPTTYNVASPADMRLKQTNDCLIRGIIAGITSSTYDILLSKYRVGTIIDSKGTRAFVRITERGQLALTTIYGSKVPSKNLEPILKSWAVSVGLCWDDFQDEPIIGYTDNADGEKVLNDDELDTLWSTLSAKYDINIPTTGIRKIVIKLAKQNRINTFTTDILNIEQRAASGVTPYVSHEDFATRFLNVSGTPEVVALHNQQMQLWFESVIAKALYPGSYFRYIPVLAGPQDIGKSRLGKIIARDDRFVSELSGIHSGTGHNCIASNEVKKLRCTRKVMVVDELDSSIKKTTTGDIKAWLEQTYSEYRPLYQDQMTKRPVHAALIATTNKLEILKDITGNTRFWMIPVGLTADFPLDQARLVNEVEGILASAARSLRAKVAADPDAMHKLKLDPELRRVNDKLNLQCLTDSPLTTQLEDLIYKSEGQKLQFIHAKKVQEAARGDVGSVFDARFIAEVEKAMNVLGYTKLEGMKIKGRAHQRLYSLRDEEGFAPKPDRTNKHPDFKDIEDVLHNSNGDF